MPEKTIASPGTAVRPAESVPVYVFVKEDNCWYVDLPEYLARGGSKADLKLVEGADELLHLIARRKKMVSVQLDIAPFDDADVLELTELCDAPKGGGYYLMRTCRNRPINKTLWLCDVALFVFGDMPERIYIKAARNSSPAQQN
jgi:hypothetical protein